MHFIAARDPIPPIPQPRMHMQPAAAPKVVNELPELPSVPTDDAEDEVSNPKDDRFQSNLDFEDLNRRFENLKKKK